MKTQFFPLLKLKIATQEYVVYLYFPEGKGKPGEIKMIIGDNDASIISHAEYDNSAGRYAYKAIKAMKECIKRKMFPIEFTQAWT